jgi:hypothetical protein
MKRLLILAACILLLSAPAMAKGHKAVILFPGSAGAVPGDFLMRNRAAFGGFATFVTTSPSQAVAIANSEHQKGNKVFLVGMSLGTEKVASALVSGAPADGAVLVSGIWDRTMGILGSPAKLPPTLAVANPNDTCPATPPSGAAQMAQWSHGKVSLRLISETGPPVKKACGPFGGHGFFKKDGAAVAAIVGFIRSH